MGLEENINRILHLTEELESSFKNIPMMLVDIDDKFQSSLQSAMQQLIATAQPIDPETLAAISRLPSVLINVENSFTDLSKRFDILNREVNEGLKFIKVSYVEDVVVSIRNLNKEIIDTVTSSTERTKGLYEASVNNFLPISDKLERIENSLNALIENQTDQLATVAELRDRVNAIIQVELAALKDRITIYLESSVNELKTSVAERLASQEEAVSKLTESTRQLAQTVANLPEVLSQQIESSVETKVVSEIEAMKKEMKKMTAFIIRTQRGSEG